jgi:hypothetical protein
VADRSSAEDALGTKPNGHRLVIVDLDTHGDKTEFLDRVAERLGFPDWFGRNWDALNDALFDLRPRLDTASPNTSASSDRDVELIVLRASDPPDSATGHAEPGADMATLLDIFTEVADEAGFCVLFDGIGAGRVPTAG